jgi:hypothetical protein
MGRLVLGQLSVTLADLESQARGAGPDDTILVPGIGPARVGDVLFVGGVAQWVNSHIAAGGAYDPVAISQLLERPVEPYRPPAEAARNGGTAALPANELVPGVPNLYLALGGGVLLLLMLKKRGG